MRKRLLSALTLGWCVAAVTIAAAQPEAGSSTDPAEIFNRRIMPIFRSDEPSSCVQCHLAAVDLKNYIRPSPEQTFASLRDQGLIDLESPRDSKILSLITMGEKDADRQARLLHQQARDAEYEAFASWIEACASDTRLRELPVLTAGQRVGPGKPDEVIRHARKSRVVDSFARQVWSQRMRCFPCHTPHEIDPSNPRQQAAVKTMRELEQHYDERLMRRLPIFKETPEATLEYLIERSREPTEGELPLVNLHEPEKSLLVLKPMSKLPAKGDDGRFAAPTYNQPVSHLGGLKMHADDHSYKAFMAWIMDYARVVGDRYVSVDQLPADNWRPTDLVLRLTDAPVTWPVDAPVQLFVHARDGQSDAWSAEPVAFTQGRVTPRGVVNGKLFLFASAERSASSPEEEFASLPRGAYVVRVYVDADRRLVDDPTLLLGPDEFCGQAELPRARWRAGFRQAETVSAGNLEKAVGGGE